MTSRSALLVGSLPFTDEEACMRRALAVLGPALLALPDGEVGDKTPQFPRGNRIAWVIYAIEVLTADPATWQIVKEAVRGPDGMAIDYQHIQKLTPRRSPSAVARTVSLGYDRFFRQSYPRFQELRAEHGLTDLPFQVGIPTGFAMGFAFANALDWLRYTTAFNSVFAREANAILREAGDDVVLQIELPPEVYAAYLLPAPLHGLALWPLHDLLRKIRPRAQIGLHLCLGDFHNEALVHPKSLHRMVALSNRLVAGWPQAHTLRYVHYPLAEGAVPPTRDLGYYAALRDVVLPAGTRFVAGFVHEALSLAEHARILAAIEEARGQRVDVASSCGLGRRTPEAATQVLQLTREVGVL